ncbi:MAG: cbb3-type cytochrome oxidase assembly protein CcoS [Alcanivoracaceae bacterium]|nr:cbb3-type cytochrome oxidase assembly protein CcoS [Alcanivoracaceae bacterium]
MNMIFVLVVMSLALAGFAIWAFFWAVKNNQFDDLDTPAYSILDDDDDRKENLTPTDKKERD